MKNIQKFAGIPYSDLSSEQRSQWIKHNRNLSTQSWNGFEATKKKKEYSTAAKCFLNAFELNNSDARYIFEKSRKKQSAASSEKKQLDASSEDYVLLGIQNALGLGVEKNNEMADFYFRQAAEMGDARGANFLARAFEVDKNKKESIYWYRYAAIKGHTIAQADIGYACEHAEGDEKNLKEAVSWYRLAANKGERHAQFYLGCAYKNGSGVIKDETEALRWFLLAYQQRDKDVIKEIRTFTSPLALYIVYSNSSTLDAAKLLLSDASLQRYFLNEELDRTEINDASYYQLQNIIFCMVSEAKKQSIDINKFLIELLLSLQNKVSLQDSVKNTTFITFKKSVFQAINFSQTHHAQFKELIEVVVKILRNSLKEHDDFVALKTLWYRARSLDIQIYDTPLLRQIADLLLTALCTEAYALKMAPIESFHIDLLFACLDANKFLSIEELNTMLKLPCLVSPDSIEAPLNLLMKLKEYVSNEEKWSEFKPFYITTLAQYINAVTPLKGIRNNNKATKILEDLSQLSKDLKSQSQLHQFFKKNRIGLKSLANLLATLDTEGLVQYLAQELPEMKKQFPIQHTDIIVSNPNL